MIHIGHGRHRVPFPRARPLEFFDDGRIVLPILVAPENQSYGITCMWWGEGRRGTARTSELRQLIIDHPTAIYVTWSLATRTDRHDSHSWDNEAGFFVGKV